MLRAIIIDDEDKGRDTLHNLLLKFCPEVQVAGLADSVEDGLELINEIKPQVVFLDIEMPNADGFSLLERSAGAEFEVIFTTAFPQYAVKAFKYSVLDYLLKPINIESLQAAVSKAQKAILNKGKSQKDTLGKLALPTLEGYEIVEISDIVRCEADVNYTHFYFINRDKLIIAKPLKDVEHVLASYDFLRVHKHHLINLKHASKYVKGSGGQVVLADGAVVDVSWRSKNTLLDRLRKFA